MRVALVVMPFGSAVRPNLAAGLLKAGLRKHGVECDVKYFNLLFWRLLGAEPYRVLCDHPAMAPLVGDWIFSQVLYGQSFSDWASYEREVLSDSNWGFPVRFYPYIGRALRLAPAFLRLALESNDWSRYGLVGFTTTFEQTLSSLCLARMIRERSPGVLLALGGANVEADLAWPYMEHFPFLDFVATGEADRSLPQLCRQLDDTGTGAALEVPPGFLYRRDGEIRESPLTADAVVDLDEVPTPDYDDYFRVAFPRGAAAVSGPTLDWLPVEASRGCWWGQKSHCTFCGLNGSGMTYRRKSWRRVVTETGELARRHGHRPLQFADNILSLDFFRDLLPYWARRRDRIPKFFEIKSNLRRDQVRLLRRAGVISAQAGIESLADGTLRVMGKGVTGAQNVALIRWCVEEGLRPMWNILFGFPREDPEDYDRSLEILRRIVHLPAPSAFAPIRMDRFSPNFTRWREEGFSQIEPMPSYRHIFPFPEEDLFRVAYYFRYDHPRRKEVFEKGGMLATFGREWENKIQRGEQGELAVKPHWQDGFVLVDSRFTCEREARRLSPEELALLLACDGPVGRRQALRQATAVTGRRDLGDTLEQLLEKGIVAEIGNRLVTLALLPSRERLSAAAECEP